MSRPRLTRVVKRDDLDVTIRLTVDDLFRIKGFTAIIPVNTSFKHDHVDGGAVLIQYRDKYYPEVAAFDRQLQASLLNEPTPNIVDIGTAQRKEYPIGTVVRLETPEAPFRSAYLIATAKLNEYNRAIPDRSDLQTGLKAIWSYIALRGRKEPLVIPIVGSGRHRITANRLELLDDIVTSFLAAVERNKFTEQLTIVIHPSAFLRNAYSMDEMEEYIRFRCKFGVD
nr:macro domain-containing protein [Cohnella sp. REN36]